MQSYQKLLAELEIYADESYKAFHRKLLNNDDVNVLGVRIPVLRKIAKNYREMIDELFTFPDEYYEVTFIKLTVASGLKYDEFVKYADRCVSLIDNWATCDCFSPKCVLKHKEEFLPYIYGYFDTGKEFYQRFALVTLLHFYVEENYLDVIFSLSARASTQFYYVHMAVAWLLAEAAVKYFDRCAEFLKSSPLDKKTHNKAIQKATESFRLTDNQKYVLKGMKK